MMLAILIWLLPVPADLADRAYRVGAYARAYQLSLEAAGRGEIDRAALEFLLGNCCFRMERFPQAILHYRRALKLRPHDARLRFNLAYTEEQLGLTASPGPSQTTPLSRPWTWGLAVAAAGVQSLAIGVWCRQRRTALGAPVLALILGPAVWFGWIGWQQWRQPLEGVVLEEATRLHSGPHPNRPTLDSLPAGTLVEVLESSDRWVSLKTQAGCGWARRHAIGICTPSVRAALPAAQSRQTSVPQDFRPPSDG